MRTKMTIHPAPVPEPHHNDHSGCDMNGDREFSPAAIQPVVDKLFISGKTFPELIRIMVEKHVPYDLSRFGSDPGDGAYIPWPRNNVVATEDES